MLSFVTTSLVNNDLKHKKISFELFFNHFISRIDKLSLFSFFNKCFYALYLLISY